MRIEAPRVARAALPGQFVIVRVDEQGERIPLTIADYDAGQGWVDIVTQAIGVSTRKICAREAGEFLTDFAGPLGRPSDFVNEPLEEVRKRRYLFVAGGVGTAPVYPQVKWLREHGVEADVIIGAKTRAMLIYTEEMRAAASHLHIATDDGSEGFPGLVTDLIADLIDNRREHYDVCVSIGPMIMMKFVARTTARYGLKTIVSLNALMVDGTGMCGACRVSVGARPTSPASTAPNSTATRSTSTRRCAVRACTGRRSSGRQPSTPSVPQDINVKSDWTNRELWQTRYRAYPCANKTRKCGPPISRRSATATTKRRRCWRPPAAWTARIRAAWRPAPSASGFPISSAN